MALRLTPEERWRNAKVFANVLKEPNAMFSTAIRTIKSTENSYGADSEALKKAAVSASLFLVDVSPSLKAMFYFAAETLYPDEVAKHTELDSKTLLGLFRPTEVTAILAISYIYRRVRKRCPEAEWKKFATKLLIHARITCVVGDTINFVGTGNGMLIGAFRFLSIGLFAIKDLKGFQEYARKLKNDATLFDIEFEEKRWGCNHLEIASILAQSLGFGVNVGYGFSMAYGQGSKLPEHLEEKVFCWRTCMEWSQTFQETGEPPRLSEEDAMFLPDSEMQDLKRQANEALDCPFHWISRSKRDLTREQCLKLKLDPAISTQPDAEGEAEDAIDEQSDAPAQ